MSEVPFYRTPLLSPLRFDKKTENAVGVNYWTSLTWYIQTM